MTTADWMLASGISIFVLASAWQGIVLLPKSRRFRTDLKPGQHIGQGSSPFWQRNVLNARNYASEEGRRFYHQLRIAVAVQWMGGLLLLLSMFFS